jgi:hypothetical protein
LLSVALVAQAAWSFSVAPLAGEVKASVGPGLVAVVLSTVKLTSRVVVAPRRSLATAVSLWVPFESLVLSKLHAYGEVVSVLSGAPSSEKATFWMPLESEALALQLTVPFTVAPPAGALIESVGGVLVVGGVVVPFCTFTYTDVALLLPLLSKYTARTRCLPFGNFVVSMAGHWNGPLLSVPMKVKSQ